MNTPDARPQPTKSVGGFPEAFHGEVLDGPPGWSIRVVEETGSTNADLLDAARGGAPNRSVLMARHQTAGRGRLDRTWDAPPRTNLLMSVLFRTLPTDLHELTQRIALAAVEAARSVAGVRAKLKWPNDLLVGDDKLAGILAQAGAIDGRVDHVVVGIGINVGWAPQGSARMGEGIEPSDVLLALLVAFDALPLDVHERYRSALATIGRSVRVELPGASGGGNVVEGRAVDVERDGRIVVVDDCGVSHRFDTGDIVHLRTPQPG